MTKTTKKRRPKANGASGVSAAASNGRLRDLLEGKEISDLDHVSDTIAEHGQLQKDIAARRASLEKALGVAHALRIEIAQLEGAADKCVRDVIRWDPQLSSR